MTNADGIVIMSKDGTVRFANPAAEYILNHKAQELLGRPFNFTIPEAGESTEIEIIRNNAQKVIAEIGASEIEWGNESAYLVSLHDVTKYKQLTQHQGTLTRRSKATV